MCNGADKQPTQAETREGTVRQVISPVCVCVCVCMCMCVCVCVRVFVCV